MRVENDEDSEKKEMNNESKVKMNRLIMKMPGLSETLDMNIYEIVFILIKKIISVMHFFFIYNLFTIHVSGPTENCLV